MAKLGLYLAMSILALFLVQLAPAQQWALNGTVVNGVNCTPLQGVNITVPYNNAMNVSNSKGYYNLYIAYGPWNVTATKAGYTATQFTVPYQSSGSYEVNFAMVQPGQTASNTCLNSLHGAGSTVPTTVTVATTVATSMATTSVAASTSVAAASSAGPNNTTLYIAIVVVIIIVIVVGYFLLKGKGGKKEAAHHH